MIEYQMIEYLNDGDDKNNQLAQYDVDVKVIIYTDDISRDIYKSFI